MDTSEATTTISTEDISHSFAFFHRLCSSVYLTEEETREFFKQSLLPEEEFSAIFKLADLDKDGRLTVGEFVLFLHFVRRRLLGASLPPALDGHLKEKALPFKLPSCSDEHVARCKMAFRDHKHFLDTEGKMGVEGAKSILLRSKLTPSQLFHIWKLSDADADDKLSFPEFVVAIHLVNLSQKGFALPVSLKHKLVLKSKKITLPDLTVSSPKASPSYFTWMSASSSPLLGMKSTTHFILPSTPLSPAPGLPTPDHPFMSYSTFVQRKSPPPVPQPLDVPSSQGGSKPAATSAYVNIKVSEEGPVSGDDGSHFPPLPPLPPRPQAAAISPPPRLLSDSSAESKRMFPQYHNVHVRREHFSPPHDERVSLVRVVPISTASSPSPPPPGNLSSHDANVDFMKSLEDLTSIGSFELLYSPSPPLSPAVAKDTSGKSDDQLASELDSLVAALSEFESSVLSLDGDLNVSSDVGRGLKDLKPSSSKGRSQKESALRRKSSSSSDVRPTSPRPISPRPTSPRPTSQPVDTTHLLTDSGIFSLQEAIEGAIRDTSPIPEIEEHVEEVSQQPTAAQEEDSGLQQKETASLISSLQSVGESADRTPQPRATAEPETELEAALASLNTLDQAPVNGLTSRKPPVAKKPKLRFKRLGSHTKTEAPVSPEEILKDELDSISNVFKQFS